MKAVDMLLCATSRAVALGGYGWIWPSRIATVLSRRTGVVCEVQEEVFTPGYEGLSI